MPPTQLNPAHLTPAQLSPAHFGSYPPLARQLALANLPLLRRLPLAFLPSLLQELIDYDTKFPVERAGLDQQFRTLAALPAPELATWFAAFAQIRLSPAQTAFDWVAQPRPFNEQFSAYLWSTDQMDTFRAAATAYGDRLRAATPPQPLPLRRLGIAVIGQGATPTQAQNAAQLFRNLRPHGTHFTNIDPQNGLQHLLTAAAERAQAHPAPYAHWYVDGGTPAPHSPSLGCVSYAALSPVRDTLLSKIQKEAGKPGMGPEQLRNGLARLSPTELGLHGDPVLDHFQVSLLTEGSGTQIFSTTFAQWTARELLRRAEALTLLVRFAPRQRQRPMDELLSSNPPGLQLDPAGSLIDADMAAYYHWLGQQRLPGAQQSAFLVWFEDQPQALAIGPTLPRNAQSSSPLNLQQLLALTTA